MEFKTVVCNLGDSLYGIDITCVRGIEREQEIVQVPNTASYIKGIMNLRGEIIPIYSLRKKFGMEEKVDGVGEIFQADETTIYDAPRIVVSENTRYIDKVLNDNGKLIITIDITELLDDDEKKHIERMVDNCKTE